jgi:hypothetical protein
MKVANLNLAQWLNYWQRGASTVPKNLFLFLVCIVVL